MNILLFDTAGSYAIPFTTVAVVSFMGASLFLLLGEPAQLSARAGRSAVAAD